MGRIAILILGLMLMLQACAQQPLYVWNNYEDELYRYYQDPEKLAELMAALQTTIADNEQASQSTGTVAGTATQRRMPPGLYAEYGYLLLISNRQPEAKGYFQKEKDTWPESTVLMDRMISVASNPHFTFGVTAAPATAGK
jgi:hypothetical protein